MSHGTRYTTQGARPTEFLRFSVYRAPCTTFFHLGEQHDTLVDLDHDASIYQCPRPIFM
jgi:hypothetical protein